MDFKQIPSPHTTTPKEYVSPLKKATNNNNPTTPNKNVWEDQPIESDIFKADMILQTKTADKIMIKVKFLV